MHRQLLLSVCDNRYLGQSDESCEIIKTYIISVEYYQNHKGIITNSVLYSREHNNLFNTDSLVTLS